MSSMTCIGDFGGKAGTWFAQLDFEGPDGEPQATILQRARAMNILVATVPLGRVDAKKETLDPADKMNQRLMRLVYAKRAWETIEAVRQTIADRLDAINYPDEGELTEDEAAWADAESDMLDELERVLALLDVPTED